MLEQIILTLIPAILGGGGLLVFWINRQDNKKINTFESMLNKQLNPIRQEIQDVDSKLVEHIEKDGETKADQMRTRILRFSDELSHNIKPSKEHFDDILETIDRYELYCNEHDKYLNSKADVSIEFVRETYKQLMKRGEL